MASSQNRAVLETALAIFLWAVSFIAIKIALRELSPFTLIAVRFGVGSLILAAAAAIRGEFRCFRKKDLLGMALVGFVGMTLQQSLQVSGQALADASVAAFLANTAPAFIVPVAALFLRESVGRVQVLGVVVATLGAGIISTGGRLDFLTGGQLASPGSLLILASAFVWAVFSVLSRRMTRDRPPILMTAGMMAFGCLFNLPAFLLTGGWQEIPGLSPQGWVMLAYICFLSTAAAYLLYNHALKQAPASRLAAIQNLEPLIASAVAPWVLHEALTGGLLVGGAAIIAGTTLAERGAPTALEEPVRGD